MTRLRTKPKAFNRRRCGRELLCRPRERNGGAETERRRYVSHASITGIALGPFQHLLVSACGAPIILSVLTSHVFNLITQVEGGDEVWRNPGDNRFFATTADTGGCSVARRDRCRNEHVAAERLGRPRPEIHRRLQRTTTSSTPSLPRCRRVSRIRRVRARSLASSVAAASRCSGTTMSSVRRSCSQVVEGRC